MPGSPKTVPKSRPKCGQKLSKSGFPLRTGNSILTIIYNTSGTSAPPKIIDCLSFWAFQLDAKTGSRNRRPKKCQKERPKGAERVLWESQESNATRRESPQEPQASPRSAKKRRDPNARVSPGGGVGATCGCQGPKGRTTGGARKPDRDPTRLMTPKG